MNSFFIPYGGGNKYTYYESKRFFNNPNSIAQNNMKHYECITDFHGKLLYVNYKYEAARNLSLSLFNYLTKNNHKN